MVFDATLLATIGPKQVILLGALGGWLMGRYAFKWPGLLLTLQLVSAVVVEVWANGLAWSGDHNLWLYNRYSVVEFLCYLLFSVGCMKDRKVRWAALMSAVLYLAMYGYERNHMEDTSAFMSHTALFGAVLLASAFTYLLFTLAESEVIPLHTRPEFWLFLGIVIYYGGMSPLLGLLDLLNERDQELADRLYVINDVLFYVSNALLIFASLLFRRKGSTLWATRT